MICRAFGKGAATHATCKNWYEGFREGDFKTRSDPANLKNFKTRNRNAGSKLQTVEEPAAQLEAETFLLFVQ